jgi:hypothetical protein
VECTIAHFFSFSFDTPKSAMTRDEKVSFGTAAEHPRVIHMGQAGVGAADHDRNAGFLDCGRGRLYLGAADRADDRRDVRVAAQFRKRQHRARVGRLVVFDHQFDLLAQDAALLVDRVDREPGAVEGVAAGFCVRTGDFAD